MRHSCSHAVCRLAHARSRSSGAANQARALDARSRAVPPRRRWWSRRVVVWRRDWIALAAPARVGPCLRSCSRRRSRGSVLRLLRYFIVVIPLMIVMVGITLARRSEAAHRAGRPTRCSVAVARRRLVVRSASRRWPSAVAIALSRCHPGGLPGGHGPAPSMSVTRRAPGAASNPGRSPRRNGWHRCDSSPITQVAGTSTPCTSAEGTVLVDDFLGFVIVMSSSNTEQFVITSDRDFQQVLADPAPTASATSWCPRSRRWASSTPSTAPIPARTPTAAAWNAGEAIQRRQRQRDQLAPIPQIPGN